MCSVHLETKIDKNSDIKAMKRNVLKDDDTLDHSIYISIYI